MKRITLFSVLFILALTAWSQPRIQLSFTGSPSLNWMKSNNQSVDKEKIVAGYDFGLNGDIFFSENERYSLFTGLQILNTGGSVTYREAFKFSGKTMPPSTKIRYRLRYVEIPLAIKLINFTEPDTGVNLDCRR